MLTVQEESPMNASRLAFLVAGAILASWSGIGLAAPTVYLDSGVFIADTGAILLEDFEAVFPKDTALLSFTSNGATYMGVQPGYPNVEVASPGDLSFGVPSTTSSVLTSAGNEEFTLDLNANSAGAVGFDVYLNGSDVTTQWYGGGGNLLMTVHDIRPAGQYFLGLAADEPIYRIAWTAVDGAYINTGIDNVYLGTAPAPGAVLLGAIGTVLVGWLRGRKML
jgi:hypothetical protein